MHDKPISRARLALLGLAALAVVGLGVGGFALYRSHAQAGAPAEPRAPVARAPDRLTRLGEDTVRIPPDLMRSFDIFLDGCSARGEPNPG